MICPVPVTTRIIMFLVGDSFATVTGEGHPKSELIVAYEII